MGRLSFLSLKMNKQKYVFRCIKDQTEPNQFGLSRRKYKKGQFITDKGHPTNDVNLATVVTLDEYNPLEDSEEMTKHFQAVPVKICVVLLKPDKKYRPVSHDIKENVLSSTHKNANGHGCQPCPYCGNIHRRVVRGKDGFGEEVRKIDCPKCRYLVCVDELETKGEM